LVAWQAELARHWSSLRFGSATIQKQGEEYLFQVQVFLDDMKPDAVRVELYAEGQNGTAPITQAMNRGGRLAGAATGFTYSAVVPITRPAADYTPRLVPQHLGALVPLEAPFILWHESPSWR
jgi:starch phosphorylase